MNRQSTISELLANILLPEPHLSKLNFCSSNKANKVSAWVDALHSTQISRTSALLYKALPEIHQLKCSPETRFAMLEALRPTTQNIIKGLTKNVLQQSITAPSEIKKATIVAQSLQKNMLDGYTRCVYDFCNASKLSSAAKAHLPTAIHRSITGIGSLFFWRYQLYTHPPTGLWLRLHSLFEIAEHYDLLAKSVIDELLVNSKAINIQCAYVRILMMSAAKLNQLSKNDVQLLYDMFEDWSTSVKLMSNGQSAVDNLFAVALDLDAASIPKKNLKTHPGRVIEINFHSLVARLSTMQQADEGNTNDPGLSAKGPTVPNSLVTHLLNCWSAVSERKQERRDVQSTADICIGLVDCHQVIGGGLSFDEFNRMGGLGAKESRLSMFPNEMNKPAANKHNEVNSYRVSVQNFSAGGFRLLWKGGAPHLQSGDFIGIKSLGKRTWSLCVVRWINQLKQGTQLGIQLLSKSPIAAGAAQEYDMGGHSDYMRVFLSSYNQSLSITTPVKPFKENDRVKLYDGEGVYSIRLGECFFSTSMVKQFSYMPHDKPGSSSVRNSIEQKKSSIAQRSFDNSWD